MENIVKCMMCSVRCASNDDLIKHGNNIEAENVDDEINYVNENNDFIEDGNDVADDDPGGNIESTMTTAEKIQHHAVKLLLNIRENCKIPQKAMETIIDGIEYYVNMTTSIIMSELQQLKDPDTNTIGVDVVRHLFMEQYSPAVIFSSMNTQKKLDKILENKFNMIRPQEVLLYKEYVWKKNKQQIPDLQEVCRFGYIVPFLQNLKVLLNNDQVRNDIDNQEEYDGSLYKTVIDGQVYRDSDFFKNNALGIILYYDDLGVANPLGVSTKAQKISVFYWSIANIDPRYRYSKYAIQLLAIAKTEWLKKNNALSNLLKPFIQDIQTLQTEGIKINLRNRDEKVYRGSLLFCSGDTPASAQLGGFKESTSAYRLCRHCMITQDEWKIMFSMQNFVLRDITSHTDYITAITQPNLRMSTRNFWTRRYGVNCRSPLLDIPGFNVTKSLPQDAMHVLIEGVMAVACKQLLSYLINDKNIFTVNEFNNWRVNFNYYGHLKRDMPAIILQEHLADNGTLHQNASQMFVLAHMLLFLIANSVMDIEDNEINEKLVLHVLLLKISNVLLAYEIHESSLVLLEGILEIYVRRFNDIYPNCIIPKFHFLFHIYLVLHVNNGAFVMKVPIIISKV